MKLALTVITTAAVGCVCGLLAAWGVVAYSLVNTPNVIVRPINPLFVFMLLPAGGAIGGLLIGLTAIVVQHRFGTTSTHRESLPKVP